MTKHILTYLLILSFTISHAQKIGLKLDGTFWKNKSFVSLGGQIDYQNWGIFLDVGGGPLGTGLYQADQKITAFGEEYDVVYPPYTSETRPDWSKADYNKQFTSKLRGLVLRTGVMLKVRVSHKKLIPFFQIDVTYANITDNFETRFFSWDGTFEMDHEATYNFWALGVGSRAGLRYQITDQLDLRATIGGVYYFPYNTINDTKEFNVKYTGNNSVFERSNGEFQIGLGYTF